MSTHKTNPKKLDLESVNDLSADKRALLAKRLTKVKQKSADHKPENARQNISVLDNRFVERFRALMRQPGSYTPEVEILAWFESADDEMKALQRKAENGDSILAANILSRVQEAFLIQVPIDLLFEDTFTIARLASAFEQYQIEQADPEDISAMLAELNELSDDEVRALLAGEQA